MAGLAAQISPLHNLPYIVPQLGRWAAGIGDPGLCRTCGDVFSYNDYTGTISNDERSSERAISTEREINVRGFLANTKPDLLR